MSIVIIPFRGTNYKILYSRKEQGDYTSIHVLIDHLDIQKYTGFSFYISISHTDNVVSYPISGPADQEIKKEIVSKIFWKEKISPID